MKMNPNAKLAYVNGEPVDSPTLQFEVIDTRDIASERFAIYSRIRTATRERTRAKKTRNDLAFTFWTSELMSARKALASMPKLRDLC